MEETMAQLKLETEMVARGARSAADAREAKLVEHDVMRLEVRGTFKGLLVQVGG